MPTITKGNILSEVYIKPEEMQGSNRIERVCQKGFEFTSKSGMEFTMGQVDINPKEKGEYELLVVKICPRRSYPVFEDNFNTQYD